MVSLTDIVAIKRTVKIGDHDVPYDGITGENIGGLFDRFPDLSKAFSGRREAGIKPSDMMNLAPNIVAAIIAAGTGNVGDEKEEAAARKLPLGDQATLLTAIVKATFPRGVSDFVASLEELGLGSLVAQRASTGELGKAPDTKLPSPSSDASATDTPKKKP